MPALTADAPLSVLSNSANSSLESPTRKSHEKTISGVFAYTNGTDVETGFPEHRLEQLRGKKGASQVSLQNGLSKVGRERSPSIAGSTHSSGSRHTRAGESLGHTSTPSDGLTKLSNVRNASESSEGEARQNQRPGDLTRLKTDSDYHSDGHMLNGVSPSEAQHTDGQRLSPVMNRYHTSLSRFSSPPGMSPGASFQDRHSESDRPVEMPKLTQRHTLQVPRASTATGRSSREFSLSAPSEDAATATGRISPTRDQDGTMTRRRRASLGLTRRVTRATSDAYLEEVPPDEDAARWTELIKQKRANRRRRREEEDDDRVIVGKKVEEGHVNWVIAYNMLTGIRFTVSRTNAKIDRQLTDADFDARHKFSFDVTGNELTPSAKYDFKFKDYSPWVFRHLRSIFGLDPADYLMSLTSKYILSELGSPGKSGSFFYFSRDYKYIIKTIHHAEHKLLRKILRDYYHHVKDNPNTLISQFYGLHRVKIPYGRKIHFVVMNNLFPPHRDIHQTFDLKGSTIGRDFKEEDLESNPRATLKDLNWLRRDLHLEFEQAIRTIFLEQLQRDVQLLQRLQIMDYSLLVGMHDLEKGNDENVRATTLQVFQPGGGRDEDDLPATLMRTPSRLENARKARELRETLKKEKPVPMGQMTSKMPDQIRADDQRQHRIFYSDGGGIRATHEDGRGGGTIYYLGVIDCLTHYGLVKRLEHFWKGLSNNRSQISPIPPQAYGERFLNFITGVTMTTEEAERRKTQERNRSEVDAHNLVHHHHIPPAPSGIDGPQTEPESTGQNDQDVEKTMKKAQKATDQQTSAKGRRRSEEEDVPDRTLGTLTDDGKHTATLPVVSEAGEGGNDGSEKVSNVLDEKLYSSPRPLSAYDEKDATTKEGIQESTDVNEQKIKDSRNVDIPRLESGIIPSLSPLDPIPNPFDPQKPAQ